MLSKHVAVARTTMDAPWDDGRASRVLEGALRARRSRDQKSPAGWMFAFTGASLVLAFFAMRPSPSGGEAAGSVPRYEPRPAVVASPADSLDGGQHSG
jgi:hypothetical protein